MCCSVLLHEQGRLPDYYRASKPSSCRGKGQKKGTAAAGSSKGAAAAAGKPAKAAGGSKRKAAEAGLEQQPQDSAAADDEDDTMTAADVGMSAEDAPLLSSQDTSGKLSR
jgi:hypothetical protein